MRARRPREAADGPLKAYPPQRKKITEFAHAGPAQVPVERHTREERTTRGCKTRQTTPPRGKSNAGFARRLGAGIRGAAAPRGSRHPPASGDPRGGARSRLLMPGIKRGDRRRLRVSTRRKQDPASGPRLLLSRRRRTPRRPPRPPQGNATFTHVTSGLAARATRRRPRAVLLDRTRPPRRRCGVPPPPRAGGAA